MATTPPVTALVAAIMAPLFDADLAMTNGHVHYERFRIGWDTRAGRFVEIVRDRCHA